MRHIAATVFVLLFSLVLMGSSISPPQTGTAAQFDVGTTPDDVVQLDGTAKLPAVDGSQLTNVSPEGTDVKSTGQTAGKVLTSNGSDGATWATSGGGGGATTALDNLAAVAINTALLPATDGSASLGSTTKRFDFGWLKTGLGIGLLTEPLEGGTAGLFVKDDNASGAHISLVNPNAGASAFSEVAVVEDGGVAQKFGAIVYKNSGGALGAFPASSTSLVGFDGSVGGVQMMSTVSAPLLFKTTATERARITDSYSQFLNKLFVGNNTTSQRFGPMDVYESFDFGRGLTVTNPNSGTSAWAEVAVGEDMGTGKFGGFIYVNSNNTFLPGIGQNFMANQFASFAQTGATNGYLIQTLAANAPIRFAVPSVFATPIERMKIDTSGVTMPSGNIISGGTTVQRAGSIGPVVSLQASGNGYIGFEAFNAGTGTDSFEAVSLGEDYATGKFGGFEYANNSFFEGTIYVNNQFSMASKSGASNGILINTEAASAPVMIGTNSTERMKITDTLVTIQKPVLIGGATVQTSRLENLLLTSNSNDMGKPLTVLNTNGGGSAFAEANIGNDIDTNRFGSIWYLGNGYSDSGIFKKNQFVFASRPGATNGILLDTFGVDAPIVLANNDTAHFTVTSSNATANGVNLVVDTAGKGLKIKSGTNGMAGKATLVAGTVAVANTLVTANTICLATVQTLGTVAEPRAVQCAPNVGVGIDITSADATDTSVVAYHLIEAN
jgi:hypothetical protein